MKDYNPKKSKVILIGKGYEWWTCPKDPQGEFEVWGINDLIMRKTDIDLMFNIHLLEDYCDIDMAGVKFANSLGIPIIMPKEYPDIPMSIRFPLEEIMKEFDTDYFMTGIAFMIAYAIYKEYKQIDCYGINMRGADEKYKNARACVDFWLGAAKSRHIKVNMYGKYCDCLKAFDRRIYGFNDFQTQPQVINDRALYVSFGASLDRGVIDTLHRFLSAQKNSKYFNNFRAIPINDFRDLTLFGNLDEIIYKHGDSTKFVGDIGFYNMLHVDKIINTEHSCRIICLEGDKEKSIQDWLKFSADTNPWTDPKGKYWNGAKSNEIALFFPKYDLPKEEALAKFYHEYYMVARRSEYKYPGYIRHWKAEKLDSEEGRREILKFLGYQEDEMVLELPDKPIPIPPPVMAQAPPNPEEMYL